MQDTSHSQARASRAGWLTVDQCKVSDLAALCQTVTAIEELPNASAIIKGVPLYDCAALRAAQEATADASAWRAQLMAEWAGVWTTGPGILIMKGLYADLNVVDETTEQFHRLIEETHKAGIGGDHFAKPGSNDRVWNALEKLCLRAPDVFASYYGNSLMAMVCEAWLGPAYQMTSTVNCVNPGGAAQVAHRDYHMGFLSQAQAQRYPAHVHTVSPMLTLQGAVAHVDMPLESGPTLYLPHSHKYLPGYLVSGMADFQSFFDSNHIQLALNKGDAIFFNPALMHAAGHNRSKDIRRMANLLQISSAFGRAMESIDRVRMAQALYPTLAALTQARTMAPDDLDAALAACAEGYSFPTNLDRDPPLNGLAPQSQQGLLRAALAEGQPAEQFSRRIEEREQTRRS
ncbi:phytanoyl-CoA dioxygenase [Rhodoferax lacus]|uniref:Phytanoyl-CoA dioxygenase n=1 Tax=Rhodoferax lacus TaxID=2184758 RepID=A0A3E1R5T3_9BURK|nr:phytanoyl-CoA dioxygenase family protein [Rhodoferax lacus]RFO94694.1 phytanoyl-CoA dioxygenase [Rhodoferax lacus]